MPPKAKGKSKKTETGKAGSAFLLLMVGLPGSGKTTLGKALEKAGWIWINQDEVGNREECMKAMTKGLKKGEKVVVDRCNVIMKERKMWTSEAKKLGVKRIECVYLDVPVEVCKERALARKHHPTLVGPVCEEVIDDFVRQLNPPAEWEAFDRIHNVSFTSMSEALSWAQQLS